MDFNFRSFENHRSSNSFSSSPNFPAINSNASFFANEAIRAGFNGAESSSRGFFPNPSSVGFREFSIQRELEKDRIRAEIIAEEMYRRRMLEEEVRREMKFEREMALRRGGRELGFGSSSSSSLMQFEARVPLLTNFEHPIGVSSPLRRAGSESLPFQRDPVASGNGDGYADALPFAVRLKEIKELKGSIPEINKDKTIVLGYVLGNPYTWPEDKVQQTLHFAGRTSLLSDELYESLKKNCNGSYEEEDRKENPILCGRDIGESFENINPLFYPHTLKPKCISQQKWCQESAYSLLDYWANDKQVQASLHIRKGTKSNWIRCNKTLAYSQNVVSTVGYHQNFTQEFVRGLIYSGDQDMVVPYTGTLKWIRTLNVSISEHWRPWFVGNQVAGYATQFSNRNYHLTYTTVMGAGHTAAEYKGRECLAMIMRWFATQSL